MNEYIEMGKEADGVYLMRIKAKLYEKNRLE